MGRPVDKTGVSYLLKWGDGRCWRVVASRGARPLVDEFGRITRLKFCDQDRQRKYPRMFIVKVSELDGDEAPILLTGTKIDEALPRSGWKICDLKSLRLWSHRGVPDIICEIGNSFNHPLDIIRMWTLLDITHLGAEDSGRLSIHAAFVERDGKGILLAGPSGSGKSTICRRLPRPWIAMSDDQSLILRDDRKRYLAHPIPTWSDCLWGQAGKTWNIEGNVPLAAIFFIEQAASDEVIPIGHGKAAIFINHSSTDVSRRIWWNLSNEEKRELKKKIFDNACQLAKAVPSYILRISPNFRFWDEMEKILRK